MEVKIYVFDFVDLHEYHQVDFEAYAREMIYERFCKPFLTFHGVKEYHFNLLDFKEEISKPLKQLIQNYYTKGTDCRYYFVAMRFNGIHYDYNKERLEIL